MDRWNAGGQGPVVSLSTTDPDIVEAVEDAIAGEPIDSSELQPDRTLKTSQDFASLYIRHRGAFEAHARKFWSDQRDVDEVVQETFLRLFLAMPEIDNELQALAFSRRVLTNLCIDRYRTRQRRPMLVALDNLEAEDVAEDIEDPVAQAEDAAIVRQALALLSPLHRAALIKREIEEKPLPQIAAELDIPEESVKHVLHRARRALRRLLVGTTVQPDVDLTNSELLRIANERLAKATLRGANVLIVMFVLAVSVVGGLRVTTSSQPVRESGMNGVLTAPVPSSTVPATHIRKPDALRPVVRAHAAVRHPQRPLRIAPRVAAADTPSPSLAHTVPAPPTSVGTRRPIADAPVVKPAPTPPPVTPPIPDAVLSAGGAVQALSTPTLTYLGTSTIDGRPQARSQFSVATTAGQLVVNQGIATSGPDAMFVSASLGSDIPLGQIDIEREQRPDGTLALTLYGSLDPAASPSPTPSDGGPSTPSASTPPSTITIAVVVSADRQHILFEHVGIGA